MGSEIPFPWITGLDNEAQRQLERNFLHLQGQIGGGSATVYDALIDPGQATNASNHIYKNLTDLVANETLVAGRTFTVGVVPRNNFTIQETTAVSLAGPIAIAALGWVQTGIVQLFGVSGGTRVAWDLNNHQVTSSSAIYLSGLDIFNSTGSTMGSAFTGANCAVLMSGCSLRGDDSGNTVRRISNVNNTGPVFAWDCYFQSVAFSGNASLWDCHYSLTNAMGNFTMCSANFFWDGGTFLVHSSACTITFAGTTNDHYVRFQKLAGQIDGASTGSTITFSIQNTGKNSYDLGQLNNQLNVTIVAGAGETWLTAYNSNTVTVSSSGAMRHIRGSNTSSLAINNGNTMMEWVQKSATGANNQVLLTGAGISGVLQITVSGETPWLKVVGATDVSLQVTFVGPTIGSQAYTIDATSARCYFQTAGTSHANFSVASTNAGTNCRVGTEAAVN